MHERNEAAFRELLDERGLLVPGALASPPLAAAYTVFSQDGSAKLDVEAAARQASRFFATKIGLTVDKRYVGELPAEDVARVVVAREEGPVRGTRLCFGRPASPHDVDWAAGAEREQGTFGLARLAERCPTVWLVVLEREPDEAALLIAAVLASMMLGPIVAPAGTEIFGVRGARLKLGAG